MSDQEKIQRVKDFYDNLYKRRELKPEGVLRNRLDTANQRIAELEAENQALREDIDVLKTYITGDAREYADKLLEGETDER